MRTWAKVSYSQYKFNDAVGLKGDGARWHFGVIAQQVKAAFESEGLNACEYGVLCYDEWEENSGSLTIYEGDNLVVPAVEHRAAGSRYGIRYDEALILECAYLRSRLKG
ncbi:MULTISPECIES: tail fiber domain-containing protein [Pseudomonas]|uniref:tail fiber domain-containing protein n=1 Tax=Pseudomonas TaxID=286 RepID=UPI001F362EE1|nr:MULTISPECIES: tail fiber domain-containing protein [Pseudomonas]